MLAFCRELKHYTNVAHDAEPDVEGDEPFSLANHHLLYEAEHINNPGPLQPVLGPVPVANKIPDSLNSSLLDIYPSGNIA